MVMLIRGSMTRHMMLVKVGSILALSGVILNRLNLSIIAFKWYEPAHYVPNWMEVVVTAAVISAEIWVFRWIVLRMPILNWEDEHATARPATATNAARRLAS